MTGFEYRQSRYSIRIAGEQGVQGVLGGRKTQIGIFNIEMHARGFKGMYWSMDRKNYAIHPSYWSMIERAA